uniref:hypothetical protein n=1 Tax=Amycolatopsis sp. CA-290885 TaxID=3239925 RepID=UPI003F490E8E
MRHVFVDETKAKGYVITAAAVLTNELTAARKTMREQVMPGQRRVHFTKESDPRRKTILDAIVDLAPEITVYDASSARRRQRERCLNQLVTDLAAVQTRLLVLERDDSIEALDKKLLYQRVRELGCAETLEYRHHRAHEEPLLMIPDAIAWCWHRGGHWKERVKPLVSDVHVV